ncbi:MAG: HipA domain-containing protein [Chlamydiales bacterium]|nr:HipA domain-containing protein [Chlamydiales bacterium]
MNRCPITYEMLDSGRYSKKGLMQLSRSLKNLAEFPFSAQEQRELAMQYASKLSIQGVQPKLSVRLNTAHEQFEIVESGGTFIVKPPHQIYNEVPENEGITMRLAKVFGIDVPLHGLMYNKDGTKSYFIKRFDRIARGHKLAVEDFSQLLGHSRNTKYDSSMEKVSSVLDKHCTFPLIEKRKLFRRTLFCFLVGNEDMHLKNFSLIRANNKIEQTPAYDLLNTAILLKSGEELALPLRGKKSKLTKDDLFDYFASSRLGLSAKVVQEELANLQNTGPQLESLIQESFLSIETKERYIQLLKERIKRIR